MVILVMGCDKNTDLFLPFHHCMERYWPDHPRIIYSTETVKNPYYDTVCLDYPLSRWTARARDTISGIDDDYVLMMCDDLFMREPVSNDLIKSLCQYITGDVASINFEVQFDKDDIPFNDILMRRPDKGRWKTSMMCQLWDTEKLLDILSDDSDPWQIEKMNDGKGYTFLINASNDRPLLPFGKRKGIYDWGIVQGKWTKEAYDFLKSEGIEPDISQRGVKANACFGIVSYFPWKQPERKQRQDRLDRLLKQLSTLWPDIPVMVISQQWKYYNPEKICKSRLIRYDYPALGILGARNELRKRFLESGFDWLIMFDDDAIISTETAQDAQKYIRQLETHPDGFCFISGKGSSPYTDYNDSQLNLCAISRYIYEREPIPNVDPQKSEGFEDRIWSTLLHFRYADREFKAPSTIKCIHFKNPNETAPSTWSGEKAFNWRQMRNNTVEAEKYIAEHKELPPWISAK